MKKFALITGASGGIGQATAQRLAEEGYSLYLHYHENEQAMASLMGKLESFAGEFIPIRADLSSTEGYKTVAANIFSLDAIVHNAGHSLYGLITDLEEEDLEKLIRVHITVPMMLTKLLLPKLVQKKQGGIVVVSSIWGQTGAACEVAYSAVKGAQLSFAKALSKEVAPSGIRVNAIAAGAVDTPMMARFNMEEGDSIRQDIPLGKFASPRDIADGVVFLLSDKAAYITGQVLPVNGGWYI
ncbi:elongation factor P 5-aminopentanone reductase [Bacillus sp. T33-2]|uniref:elongation factor P 5-aminopentanone reductase n=1 Tax=Bacillus sp. T33-2 TaxID=2054168 RepID=UPI000C789D71|nr:SDR family oxidoreductase [Bacillus sp. T33-2]PLR94885.1 3-oxoacyl-ACP reductase [Bacillus sp. T33-2]